MIKPTRPGICSIEHNSFAADKPYPIGMECLKCGTFFCLSCVLDYWPMHTDFCQECEYELKLKSTSDWDSFMSIVGSKSEAEWRSKNSHMRRGLGLEKQELPDKTSQKPQEVSGLAFQDTQTKSSSATKPKKGGKKVENKKPDVSIWDAQENT
jgi:hypothetical protein